MRILREALIKEFGYKPNLEHDQSLIPGLEDRLNSMELENQRLKKMIFEADKEKIEFQKRSEQAIIEAYAKDKTITDLQNNVARLRNEIWRVENSKAPIQIFAFTLFILLLVLIFT
jgi:hypothetical protein